MENEHLEAKVSDSQIIAEGVPYEAFLAGDYGEHVEWIDGKVIAMSAVSVRHELLTLFFKMLLKIYIESTGGGVVLGDPVVMRCNMDLPARQPDILVLLPERMNYLHENEVAGPANLVIEVVSPGSEARDRGEKFREYEQGGVDEYWIVDPLRRESLFYVRGEDGLFHSRLPIDGVYRSFVLHKLQLKVNTLWEDTLPTTRQLIDIVDKFLTE